MGKRNFIDKFNFEGFEKIIKAPQRDLLAYLSEQLPKWYGEDNCMVTKDYIFAKGDIPAVLVAHLDTVHKDVVKDLFYDSKKKVIWSPQGCGGDDRCGVLGCLFIAKFMNDKKPSLFFTTDEEIGCVGTKKACKDEKLKTFVKGHKYAVEIDRKGSKDAVFYGCSNEKWQKYVAKFGFEKATGSNSDINHICANDAWNIGCVNISSGYYNPHQLTEYIRVDELFENLEKIVDMLEDIDNVKKFTYLGAKPKTTSSFSTTTTSIINSTYKSNRIADDDIEAEIARKNGHDINDPMDDGSDTGSSLYL